MTRERDRGMFYLPVGRRRRVNPRTAEVWYDHPESGLAVNRPEEVMAEEARRCREEQAAQRAHQAAQEAQTAAAAQAAAARRAEEARAQAA
eukprot:11807272-Alexandrium_andersonii.AAC.1